MADEVARADVVEFLRVAEIAIVHLAQQAGAIRGDKEVVGPSEQRVAAAFREGPCNRVVDLEVEGDTQVGIEMPLDFEVGAVRNRHVDFAGRNLRQQIGDFDVGVLGPGQRRITFLDRFEDVDVTAAGSHLDRAADQVVDRSRLAGAKAIDEVYVDVVIGVAEMQELAPGFRDGQAGRRHVGFTRQDHRQDFRDVGDRLDLEFDTEIVGKRFDQIVLRPLRSVGTDRVGRRAVAGHDSQHTGLPHLLEQRRRVGTGADKGGNDDDNDCAQSHSPEVNLQLLQSRWAGVYLTFAVLLTSISSPDGPQGACQTMRNTRRGAGVVERA